MIETQQPISQTVTGNATHRSTFYQYDELGRLLTTVHPDPDLADANGIYPAGIFSDPDNIPTTSRVYDAVGNVEHETSVLGATVDTEYDAMGRVESVTIPDPDGTGPLTATTTTFTYDAFGNQLSITLNADTALARTTDYEYDVLDRPVKVTGPFVYDAISETTVRPVTTSTYDEAGNLKTTTDARQRTTTNFYDALNRVYRTESHLPGVDVEFTYDANGNRLSETSPNGNTTRFEYDSLNRPTTVLQPDTGNGYGLTVTSTIYDLLGRTVAAVDPLGHTSISQFDSLGRVIRSIGPDPDFDSTTLSAPIAHSSYDLAGNVVASTDPGGNTTTFEYDYLNRKTIQTLPDPDDLPGGNGPLSSPVIIRGYDLAGNLESEYRTYDGATGNSGRTVHFTYDIFGRPLRTTQPDPDGAALPLPAPFSENTYGAQGNVERVTDQLGRSTVYTYDALDRPLTEEFVHFDGTTTTVLREQFQTQYDLVGNVKRQIEFATTGNLHRVAEFTYDDLDRVTETAAKSGINSELSFTSLIGYDNDGNVTSQTDPMGRTTTQAYDALGRVIRASSPDPDGDGLLQSMSMYLALDAVGNVLVAKDNLGRITVNEYDRLNRPTKTTHPDPDPTDSDTAPFTRIEYDQAGNTWKTYDVRNGETTFEYDNLYRQIVVTQPDPNPDNNTTADRPVTKTQFDNFGNVYASIDPRGHSGRFTYDFMDRVRTTWLVEADGTIHPAITTNYDDAGNVESTIDQLGRKTSFEYDDLDRQKKIIYPKPHNLAAAPETELFYDAAGNLTAEEDARDYTTHWTYDFLNRNTSVTYPDAGHGATTETMTYDAVGNLISVEDILGRTVTFAYDNLDRL
ncbi:hypothetical protein OAH18_03135, partial [bacterium]|nr:hypothetical protein [bacterium]